MGIWCVGPVGRGPKAERPARGRRRASEARAGPGPRPGCRRGHVVLAAMLGVVRVIGHGLATAATVSVRYVPHPGTKISVCTTGASWRR